MFTQEFPRSDFTEHVFEQDFVRLVNAVADSWNDGDARKPTDCFSTAGVYMEPPVNGVLKCFTDLTGLREHRGTALCDNRIYRPGSRAMDLGTICYILPSRPAQ
jgi:hypothetical protein